jgi:DNA-binding Lrp family transcriptional regulator
VARFRSRQFQGSLKPSKLPCVVEVNKVEEPYDIVAKLSDDNMNMIKESIGKHMTRIQGIQSTLTLMSE